MGWVALGRCAGGGGRLSSVLSLSLTSLASSLIFTILCILTLALTLVTLVRAEDMNLDRERERAVAKFGFPRRVQFEIRGGVLAATTMVRPAITIQQPVPI